MQCRCRQAAASDLELLREALSRLLRQDDEDGRLIVQLLVQGREPSVVAAERGVTGAMLVDQVRDAVDALAVEYEHVAFALGQSPQEQARARVAAKLR